MNLMHVDIPSKLGKRWGQLALITGKAYAYATCRLDVLVYLDSWTVEDREIDASISETLQDLLKEQHWITAWIACGVHKTKSPVKNTKGSLRSLAYKLGKGLDTSVPASVRFAKKPLV